MRDARQSPVMPVLFAVVAAGLLVSGFFLPGEGGGNTGIVGPLWLSHVLSVLVLLVTALSLNYVNSNSFLFTSDSKLLYLPYLVTVLAFPGTIHLTLYHLAAFLTVWTMYYALMYINGETHRVYYVFMAGLTSSTAAVMSPPLLYAGVLVLFYIFYRRAQDTLRVLTAYLSAMAVPWLYVASWIYIFGPEVSFGEFLSSFSQKLVPSLPSFSGLPVSYAVFVSVIVVIGLRTVIYAASRGMERNKAQKNAYGLSVALSVFMLVLELLFSWDISPLSVIVAAAPFSFAVFDFLSNGRRNETVIMLSLLLLSAVFFRVSEFLPF